MGKELLILDSINIFTITTTTTTTRKTTTRKTV
jgi:hypothetical protein